MLRKGNCVFCPGGNQWSLDQDVTTGMDSYVHLCWDRNHHMEKNIKARDDNIKLRYLEIHRSILYEPGILFTPGVANGMRMMKHTIQEAVDGGMIDYDAINRRIGPLYQPGPQARRQQAERTESLVPDHIAMKWITNFPHG